MMMNVNVAVDDRGERGDLIQGRGHYTVAI
jgi:hypothetical protein